MSTSPVTRTQSPTGAALRTVVMAPEIGFCFGVRRAIHMTEDALQANGGPVYILGDLVHNRTVTERLEARGLSKIRSYDEVEPGTMIIRAHGLPQAEQQQAAERGFRLVDATCPIVLRAQEAARALEERGCQVVIVGDANHAEIKGIVGALQQPALIVNSLEELRQAKATHRLRRKIGVVFQTTHSLELCKDIVSELVFLCKEVQVINTICRPVQFRQDAAVEIAEQVDLMVIVGSNTSANTMELAALCRAHNPWTLHVEGPDGLTEDDIVWAERVGVASGLSTPVETVEAVRDAIVACAAPVDPSRRPDPSRYARNNHS